MRFILFSSQFRSGERPRLAKNVVTTVTTATLLLVFLSLFSVAGCGGKNQKDAAPSTSTQPANVATGRAVFTVKWPEKPTRLVPVNTAAIKITLFKDRAALPGTERVVFGRSGMPETVEWDGLPVGELSVVSQCFAQVTNNVPTGTPTASGSGTVVIEEGQTKNLTITMDSTIDRLVLSANLLVLPPIFLEDTEGSIDIVAAYPTTLPASGPINLFKSDMIRLSVTAYDKDGNMVLLGPNLAWTSSKPDVGYFPPIVRFTGTDVSVTNPPGTARVKGLSVGATTITVKDGESGKTASVELLYTGFTVQQVRAAGTAMGFNNAGQVVLTDNEGVARDAFMDSDGTIVWWGVNGNFGDRDHGNFKTAGLNNKGEVLGMYTPPGEDIDRVYYPAKWTKSGGMRRLAHPSASVSNYMGTVTTLTDKVSGNQYILKKLLAINDDSLVLISAVASRSTNTKATEWVWNPAAETLSTHTGEVYFAREHREPLTIAEADIRSYFPGHLDSEGAIKEVAVYGTNSKGDKVGHCVRKAPYRSNKAAFAWTGASGLRLLNPSDQTTDASASVIDTTAYSINNEGWIVGRINSSGALFEPGMPPRSLGKCLTRFRGGDDWEAQFGRLDFALFVNDKGQILVRYYNTQTTVAYVVLTPTTNPYAQ